MGALRTGVDEMGAPLIPRRFRIEFLARRREFIALIGGAAAAWPLAARAQQPSMALVGLLLSTQFDDRQIGAIRQGLKDAGYIEGRNLAIKYRSADGRFDRLPAMAAELVADSVGAIVALGPAAALAAKDASSTTPIVFVIGADPVDLGLVSSLNRPGGNVTGVTFFINTLGAKRLELLRELMPNATVIGFLVNARNPTSQSKPQTLRLRRAYTASSSLPWMPAANAISTPPSRTSFHSMSTLSFSAPIRSLSLAPT